MAAAGCATASVARATLAGASPGSAALVGGGEGRRTAAPTRCRWSRSPPAGRSGSSPGSTTSSGTSPAAFPNAPLAVGGKRPRVEILNGTGAVGLAPDDRRPDRPGRRSGDADRQRAELRCARTRRSSTTATADRAVAQRLLGALGCGALKKADPSHRGGRRDDPRRGRLLPDRRLHRVHELEGNHLDSHRRAVTAARAAADKKAEDTLVLDVGDIIGITEVFVITSGTNTRQVRTICDEIELALKREGGERAAQRRRSGRRVVGAARLRRPRRARVPRRDP